MTLKTYSINGPFHLPYKANNLILNYLNHLKRFIRGQFKGNQKDLKKLDAIIDTFKIKFTL